jgi:hypothetical protein
VARLLGSPTLAPSGDGRLELFVLDIEGSLWHMWQTAWSNGWSGWSRRGQASSWPASVGPSGDGRLELFVVGDGGLSHSYQTAWSNGWSGWHTHAAPPSPIGIGFSAPGIAAAASGRLSAFVGNGALWRLQQTGWSNGWSDWQPHGSPPGGFAVGPVVAQRSGDGRIELFVIDNRGQMWNVRQTSPGSSFSEWNDFGTPEVALEDRPGLARSADGRLELFAVGVDGALYHRWETAVGTLTWSGWASAGKPAATRFVDHPALAPSADGRLELFVTGADGNVWHRWQTRASDGWSNWVSTRPAAGAAGAAPEVHASGDGRLELFVVGADGNLWHSYQTRASNGWSGWHAHAHP